MSYTENFRTIIQSRGIESKEKTKIQILLSFKGVDEVRCLVLTILLHKFRDLV